MAKQTINVGSSANDGTGDPNRTAFQKINANFTELYNSIPTAQQYKFLLSQTGGTTDPQTATSGTLTQGVTYEIIDFVSGDDFTLSGAPNNTVGTKWVANGVAPTWGNGSEIGWDASNLVVYPLGDCLYDIAWEWYGGGSFLGKKTGAFPVSKTFIHYNGIDGAVNVAGGSSSYYLYRLDDDTILIGTTDNSLDAFSYAPFLIEVYT